MMRLGRTANDWIPEGRTVRVTAFVAPPSAALICTGVSVRTRDVVTGNSTCVEPGGTVTLAGSRAAFGLSLVNWTGAPPSGAGPSNSSVPLTATEPTTGLG